MDETKAQELYARFMELQEQVKNLEDHFQGMQEQLRNIEKTRETILELEKLDGEKETWIPIAPGAYSKATVNPVRTILLHIGANIAVEKEPAEVMKTLNDHKAVLEELSEATIKEIQEVLAEVETIKQTVETSEQK